MISAEMLFTQFSQKYFAYREPFNLKMSSYQYRDPNVKNKMLSRPFYI